MSATVTRITAEQYYTASVEGDRKQLVDATIVVGEAKPIHGVLQLELLMALRRWIVDGDRRGLVLPPTDIALDQYNVYGPDVIWFAEEHVPADLREYPERVPDLCVEIRSPGTWRYDVGAKRAGYERGGLPELWLVDDVAATVLVYRRSTPAASSFDVALELSRGETLTSPLLPGFALALDELFRR